MSRQQDAPQWLIVADIDRWREWLMSNGDSSDGVWLLLAQKGVTAPTSVTYQQALEEALCSGWIDGQRKAVDEHTFQQRFTPRRARSVWSQRNVDIVGRLAEEGRLRARGIAEVQRAKSDGRWDRAYAGQAAAELPAELTTALDAAPEARAAFFRLTRAARYSLIHPILTAPTVATRQRRIDTLIARLHQQ